MSDWAGQRPTGPDNFWLGLSVKKGALSSRTGQCPAGGFCLWMDWKELGITQIDYFYFIQHASLNSMVFLYSRNIKK
jgi:hypothetical protein